MRLVSRLFFVGAAAGAVLLTSCSTGPSVSSGNYRVTAYRPHDPSKVKVKLSTSTQNVYVMEGDRLLMAVQSNVGKPGAATPTGHFTIYNKEKNPRRTSEPDRGYPMAYWCEFKPAYGFHEGFVWPVPHTHGCVRLHREAAARLFALTKIGTPVHIRNSLPEDKEWGSMVRRLDQSRDPDPHRTRTRSGGRVARKPPPPPPPL